MASACPHFLLPALLFFLLLLLSSSAAKPPPHALIFTITKDPTTLHYVAKLRHRTPAVATNLVVDLAGGYPWLDCNRRYVSSSYRRIRCNSPPCGPGDPCGNCTSSARPRPGCNPDTCSVYAFNPFGEGTLTLAELSQDSLSLRSTDGYVPGPLQTLPRFLFSCSPSFLVKEKGFPSTAKGVATFSLNKAALPAQVAAGFKLPRKFALCLSSSTGVAFFGDGPYHFLPDVDASKNLIHTPLLVNPVSTAPIYGEGDKSDEYFIGVTGIKVDGKRVAVNETLLAFDKEGNGGTKISTIVPYTVLETSIYKAVTAAFSAALANATRAPAVGPFRVCYNWRDLGSTRVGPAVPQIDLVLQSESVYWRIFGANSMVPVSEAVVCLGFVDGGAAPRTSVVIGGHQLEDNLLQIDPEASRLGFSSSLLLRRTSCANFNMTGRA